MKIGLIGSGEMAFGIARNIFERREDDSLIIFSKDQNVDERFSKYFAYKNKNLNNYSVIFTNSLKDLTEANLIIESTHEVFDIKYAVFSDLQKFNYKGPLLCNTSVLDLEGMYAKLNQPKNFFGAHFFNPPYRTKAMEVSKFKNSSKALYKDVLDFCCSLGKKILEMDYIIGYSINRILAFQLHEAIKIVIKSDISMKQLDETYIYAVGSVNGPIKTADIIGLDVLDKIFENVLGKNYDLSVRAFLKKYISKNHLGRKTKKGFFNYQ